MAMLALAALAVDLASLRDTKAEAQRAADVIALAGASAFRDFPWTDVATADSARNRALVIARQNKVRSDTLDVRNPQFRTNTYAWGKEINVMTQDVTLNVIPDSQKVRVWVNRKRHPHLLRQDARRAVRPRAGHGHRVGHQRGTDGELREALRDSRHVVRERQGHPGREPQQLLGPQYHRPGQRAGRRGLEVSAGVRRWAGLLPAVRPERHERPEPPADRLWQLDPLWDRLPR